MYNYGNSLTGDVFVVKKLILGLLVAFVLLLSGCEEYADGYAEPCLLAEGVGLEVDVRDYGGSYPTLEIEKRAECNPLLHALSQGQLHDIFFGEWVVDDIISVCRRWVSFLVNCGELEEAEDVNKCYAFLIGTEIYMSSDKVLIDGVVLGYYPWYRITIQESHPMINSRFIPSPYVIIRTPFHIFVDVEIITFQNSDGNIGGQFHFYIKDDNALYMMYGNVALSVIRKA